MTAAGAILSIRDLQVGIRRKREDQAIVRGVSLDVAPSEKVGIVGESGSGKSLTMLSVLQLLPSQLQILDGSIDFSGEDLARAMVEVQVHQLQDILDLIAADLTFL